MTTRIAVLAVLAALAAASPAAAAPSMEVGVADDRLMLGPPDRATATVAEWRDAGVDTVRIVARWGAIAPAPTARRAPAGFDPGDHASPGYEWAALDHAVGAATGAGMRVMLTVTGWGPVWGSRFPVKDNPRYKPAPRRFAAFARAVASRYGGLVDRYIVWNEPNTTLWMQPQSQCVRRRCTPYAPHHYRRLVRAADPAIRRADPGAKVLVGALAPRGTSGTTVNGQLRPLLFMRALGCVNRRHRRVRRGPCRRFRPAGADGFAYHPHGLKLSPRQRDRVPDQAHLADISQVVRTLDRVVRAGGIRARRTRRLPIYLDEYAYQTRPPDRILGVKPAQQARWLAQSAYIAWRHPRIRNLTWYVWEDEPENAVGGGWQSGVRYLGGRAKPALKSFVAPFWAERARRGVARLWGQARPGGAHDVTIQRRVGRRWRSIGQVRTDRRGAFRREVRIGSATRFRFRWDGGTSAARSVRP